MKKCKPCNLKMEAVYMDIHWIRFLEQFMQSSIPEMNFTMVNCRCLIDVWPFTSIGSIRHLETINCRINDDDFAGLLTMTSPKQLRLYGAVQGHLGEIFRFVVRNLPNLKTIFMYNITLAVFPVEAETAFFEFIRMLVQRNTTFTIVFNSEDFAPDHEMDFSVFRVNFFRLHLGNGSRRAWQKIQYNSQNKIYLRDVHGAHVFDSDDLWH